METHMRRQSILAMLRESGALDVDMVAAQLGVSPNTIRNDFNALAAEGQLQRIRGGATSLSTYRGGPDYLSDSFEQRLQQNTQRKDMIGRWAAELVQDGDSILFDASTSAYTLAAYLKDRQNLTVVTTGVESARRLARNPTNTVLLLGGLLRSDGVPVTGMFTDQTLRELRIKLAIVSASGITPDGSLMEGDIREAQLKQRMLEAAGQTVVVVDSSKFGRTGVAAFGHVEQLSHLFTDSGIASSAVARLRESGANINICDEHGVTTFAPCERETRHYVIGFANQWEQASFPVEVRRGLERAAKEAGNVDLVVGDNQLSESRALEVAERLIAAQPDLVIEYQLHERLNAVLMEKFRSAGIPVIAVDIPIVGATYFGADNYRAGHMAGVALGSWVQEHWAGKLDCVLVLEEPRAGTSPAARIQGQLDGLSQVIGPIEPDKIVRLDSGNQMHVSEISVAGVLPQLADLHSIAVLPFNEDAAMGALQAARRLGREEDVIIVGQGASLLVRHELQNPESRIMGATSYHPERYGEELIRLALKILRGEPAPPAVNIQHSFIYAGAEASMPLLMPETAG